MGFNSNYLYLFHYSDSRSYLIFRCHNTIATGNISFFHYLYFATPLLFVTGVGDDTSVWIVLLLLGCKKDNLVSDTIIDKNIVANPQIILMVRSSLPSIAENIVPKTDSRLRSNEAVEGVVCFCPKFCKSSATAVQNKQR